MSIEERRGNTILVITCFAADFASSGERCSFGGDDPFGLLGDDSQLSYEVDLLDD